MNRCWRARSLLASVLLAGLAAGTGCMPLFPAPEPPGLSKKQANDVLACQVGLDVAGRKFVEHKMKELETCAQNILAIRLPFENEQISEDEYLKKLDGVRDGCNKNFKDIQTASTRFVDKVIDACDPVAEWILDWDELSFLILNDETSGFPETGSVEELAGSMCTMKELIVDQMVFFQMPRLMELLSYLGEDYVVITSENDFPIGYPNIPLDDRCAPIQDMAGLL
jgi:hypothetical protein